MSTQIIKQHDTARKFAATLTIDGSPVVLTGATISFIFRNTKTGTVVKRNGTIVSPTGGTVEYQLVAGDVSVAGTFQVEIEVVFADAKILTFPDDDYVNLTILGDLG